MQNKANFRKGEMSASPYNTKAYENLCVCRPGKNKPNQSQFKAKANVKMDKPYSSLRRTPTPWGGSMAL